MGTEVLRPSPGFGLGVWLCLAVGGALATELEEPATVQQEGQAMTAIVLTVGGERMEATLEDNPAARDFLSRLPLTLTLEDYHGIEKVSDLARPLSTEGAPEGFDPGVGDITYYAPWGNLAIFYRDFGYARGLVSLGKIESGLSLISGKGEFEVTIERAK
jgi:hypothetical protein